MITIEEARKWLELGKEFGLLNNIVDRVTKPEALEAIARGLTSGLTKGV